MSDLSVPHRQGLDGFQQAQISGKVNESARRFEVNLHSANGEVLMHFNARFDENCVVRSSTKDGHKWQTEDRQGGMPFHPGNPFTLQLVAGENDTINCVVNGTDFCQFQAHESLSNANALEVNGDIQLNSLNAPESAGGRGARETPRANDDANNDESDLGDPVRLEPSEPDQPEPRPTEPEPRPSEPEPTPQEPEPPRPYQPQPMPTPQPTEPGHPQPPHAPHPEQPDAQPVPGQMPGSGLPEPQQPVQQGQLSVPYHGPMEQFAQTNRMRIVGTPNAGAQRFQVDMKSASGEVIFHFNPRFDQNCVVRNATQNHQFPYETEERDGHPCPFHPGKQFALDFLVHGNMIRIFVDGQEVYRFTLRHNLTEAQTIEILGDLQLNQVMIA
jgi:hypothetical protein